jgi:hypothetical protein
LAAALEAAGAADDFADDEDELEFSPPQASKITVGKARAPTLNFMRRRYVGVAARCC